MQERRKIVEDCEDKVSTDETADWYIKIRHRGKKLQGKWTIFVALTVKVW